MSHWFHPPEMHYSLRSRFAWPAPPAGPGAAAGTAANAAGPTSSAPPLYEQFNQGRSHGHGYGRGYYYRPRFGLFRRMVWVCDSSLLLIRNGTHQQFGLGVGAASWYIHHNDRRNQTGRCLSERESTLSPTSVNTHLKANESDKGQQDWRERWRYLQDHRAELARPLPSVAVPANPASFSEPESRVISSLPAGENDEQKEEGHQWGWGARRRERRRRREEARASKVVDAESGTGEDENEEVRKIKEAVEKIWAERKQAAVDIQATANEKVSRFGQE